MDKKAIELANYRLERAKQDLADTELLYKIKVEPKYRRNTAKVLPK